MLLDTVQLTLSTSYLMNCVRPFPLVIFIMFCSVIIWAIDLSLRPYLLKVILNHIASGAQHDLFSYLAIPISLYLSMSLATQTFQRLYNYFVDINMLPKLRARIVNNSLDMLFDKSHTYYQNNYLGSLANKVNDLSENVFEIIEITISTFFAHALAITIAIFTLWQINMFFALCMLVWVAIFILGSLLFSSHLAMLASDWSEIRSTISGKIVDVLSNILSVRLFAGKSQEQKSLAKTFQIGVDAEQKLWRAYFYMWSAHSIASFTLLAFNFYFLLKGREEGWVTVGDFALVMLINISILDFIMQTANNLARFTRCFGHVKQALKAILPTPEILDKPGAIDLKVIRGRIDFEKVKFHYKDAEPLFENKSTTIEAGQKIGLVGYSGSGKTTFVNLILRLYEVTGGQILIDEQNISEITQKSLYTNIAMIPQDPSLFHRSLLDNIRYGKVDATETEVIEAAKRAHAHDFIMKLPHGYESLVGERGVKLSGGQRQRIAIARAILKNAPILILDEATSQLDSITENYIQDSLWELMQGKTTIIIAHRLSTLLNMDRILVFEQGKIIEDGTHNELLLNKGMYSTLWSAQVGGFLPDKYE